MRCCCPCGAPSDEDDVYRRHVDPAEPTADPVVAAVPSVAVGEDDFESLRVLGRGTYGKVVQARKRGTGQLYALKIMRKEDVLSRNQVRHTLTERHVLQSVRHPFVIGLQFAFQTADKLYLVLPFMAGGELFFHLQRERTFSEARVLLYASEILLALQELHRHDIVYRDLKPGGARRAHDASAGPPRQLARRLRGRPVLVPDSRTGVTTSPSPPLFW